MRGPLKSPETLEREAREAQEALDAQDSFDDNLDGDQNMQEFNMEQAG